MIAIPGKTTTITISAIIADEAAIGMVNNKTTTVRIIPAPSKDVGDMVEYGGLLGKAPVMNVSKYASEDFIIRGEEYRHQSIVCEIKEPGQIKKLLPIGLFFNSVGSLW